MEKRKKKELLFNKIQKELIEAIRKDAYPIEMLSNIEYLLPNDIFERFNKMVLEKNKSPEEMRNHYYDICRLMKKSLSEIDSEIEKQL